MKKKKKKKKKMMMMMMRRRRHTHGCGWLYIPRMKNIKRIKKQEAFWSAVEIE
jgi:hypothetical protein